MYIKRPFSIAEITDPSQVRMMVMNGEQIGHVALQEILNVAADMGGTSGSGNGGRRKNGGKGTDMTKPEAAEGGGCSIGRAITLVIPEHGVGDMRSGVYDPTCTAKDVFDMDSMREGSTHLILIQSEREKIALIDQMQTDITSNKESVVEIRGVADQAKATADQAKTQSQEALTQSINAVDASNEAKKNSEDALRISGEAKTEADKAVVTSRGSDAKADQAVQTANAAVESANKAVDTSNDAKKKAEDTDVKLGALSDKTDRNLEILKNDITQSVNELRTSVDDKVTQLDTRTEHKITELTTRVDTVRAEANKNTMDAKTEALAAAAKAQKCCDDLKPLVDGAVKASTEAKTASDGAVATANDAKAKSTAAEDSASKAQAKAVEMAATAVEIKKVSDKALSVSEHANDVSTKAYKLADDAQFIAANTEDQVRIVNFYLKRNQRKIVSLDGDLKTLDNTVKNLTFTSIEPWKPFLYAKDRKSLILRKNTTIGISNTFYTAAQDVTVNIGNVEAGKDYYVYLVLKAGKVSVSVSPNSTFPRGSNAANSRKIGGFHTLCSDVGVIANHPLSGYTAKSVLPLSVWCLNHRPCCSPEGMVWCCNAGVWVDIYLQSGTDASTKSAFGGSVVNKRPYYKHLEDYHAVGKRLLNRSEFIQATLGSNEGASVFGKTAANYTQGTNITTGGNVVANNGGKGRRMISNIGVEDGCGYFAQCLDDLVVTYHYRAGTNNFTVLGAGGLPLGVGATSVGVAFTAAKASDIRPYGLTLLASTASPEPHATGRGCSPNIVRGL